MLDVGWAELLVIAIVLIVVVGPKDLPPMIRAFGRTMASLRKMTGEFRTQFDQALKGADMDDVRKTIGDVQNLNPTNALRDAINPLRQIGNDIRSDMEKSVSTSTSSAAPATEVNLPEPQSKLPETPPEVPVVDVTQAAPIAAATKSDTVNPSKSAPKAKATAKPKVKKAEPATAPSKLVDAPAKKVAAKKAPAKKKAEKEEL